jgi:endoglucanase
LKKKKRPPPPRKRPPPPRKRPPPPRKRPPPPRKSPPPPRSPPPRPPPPSPPPPYGPSPLLPGKDKYAEVLSLAWKFYQAQRAGDIPPGYPIPWITTSLTADPIQPGWYDAGDTLKLNFPLSGSVSFLAWGLVDFRNAYSSTGQLNTARDTLRPAVDYLLNSYTAPYTYTGQIGEADIDHQFWGRPSQYPINTLPRQQFVWTQATKQADLLGSTAAALAAASLVYKDIDSGYAENLKNKAVELWDWGTQSEGLYSLVYPIATAVYLSTDWADDMAWGAAWLYRATGDSAKYLTGAQFYWGKEAKDPYPCWDSKWAPTAAMLLSLSDSGAVSVPGVDVYRSYMNNEFLKAWLNADGFSSIVKTPKGMAYPSWSKWGNLRYATTAAMVAVAHAKNNPDGNQKAAELAFAQQQLDYALGSTDRSFVVGYGSMYPLQPHHAGSSCPDMPAPCGWAQYSSPAPNPQIIYGALVGGPEGALANPVNPDDSYYDVRSNINGNEPACDYNAGFATALAGLWQQT